MKNVEKKGRRTPSTHFLASLFHLDLLLYESLILLVLTAMKASGATSYSLDPDLGNTNTTT